MSYGNKEVPFESLKGKIFTDIIINEDRDEIFFINKGVKTYKMFHEPDCCESVYVESVVGEISDLIGSPILTAEESTKDGAGEKDKEGYVSESATWTFYKLSTIKGYVDIRWYGQSNGYYSESVSLIEM